MSVPGRAKHIIVIALAAGVAMIVATSVRRAVRRVDPAWLGVQLDMTPTEVRRAFSPGQRGAFRNEGDDLEWRPTSHRERRPTRASFEFHGRRLVAIELLWAPGTDPARLRRRLPIPPADEQGRRQTDHHRRFVDVREGDDGLVMLVLDPLSRQVRSRIARLREPEPG